MRYAPEVAGGRRRTDGNLSGSINETEEREEREKMEQENVIYGSTVVYLSQYARLQLRRVDGHKERQEIIGPHAWST